MDNSKLINYTRLNILFLAILFPLYTLAALRDPTQPPLVLSKPNDETGPLQLNGILISKNRKVAIINSTVLQIGNQINGSTLLSIEPNAVQLEGPDGKVTLFLIGQSFKRPS